MAGDTIGDDWSDPDRENWAPEPPPEFQDKQGANGKDGDHSDAVEFDSSDPVEADIPRRPWVAPGYLLRGSVTVLAGPPSALKSTIALSFSVSLALYVDYGAFRPIAAGTSLNYNVEDDLDEQRRRLAAARRFFGPRTSLNGRVIRASPTGAGTLLGRDELGAIVFTAALQTLEAMIKLRKPDVLICDPLAELHIEQENDNTALRAVIAEFRRLAVTYNMAVLILHHTRKNSGDAIGDPDVARGASAIIGAARIVLLLKVMSEADAKEMGLATDLAARSNYVRLDSGKSNYAPLSNAVWFEKVAYTLDNGDQVAAALPWNPPEAKLATESEIASLTADITKGSAVGPYSPKLSPDARSVKPLLEKHGFTGKAAQKAVLSRLADECSVETDRFKSGSRNVAHGLHVKWKPNAEWIKDDSDDEA